MSDLPELRERLIAGAVWSVLIADHHADVLTPRMIERLYDASNAMREADATIQKLAELEAENAWRPVSEAEYNTPVEVRAGQMTFHAMLVPDAAMASMDESCDQWQATIEGEHPPCWSGGACWEVNEDEVASLPPTHFRPLPSPPKGPDA